MTRFASTRLPFFLLALALLLPLSVQAQQVDAERANEAPFAAERSLVESTLHTLVEVLREVTFQNDGNRLGDRLQTLAARLNEDARLLDPLASPRPEPDAQPLVSEADRDRHDLRRLQQLLREMQAELTRLRADLEAEQEHTLADRLAPLEGRLDEAVEIVTDLSGEAGYAETEDSPYLQPGYYEAGDRRRAYQNDEEGVIEGALSDAREGIKEGIEGAREGVREGIEGAREGVREGLGESKKWRDRDEHDHDDWYRPDFDWYGGVGTFIGAYDHRWPFRETALYRPIPALRYNRVEGLVLGFGLRPLAWEDYERGKIYGQIGYAFALEDIRYEVGAETRVDDIRNEAFGLKVGGAYRRNTATDDLWKASWTENTLAAFFFEQDYFDYYQVEGWTLYTVFHATPYLQFGAGFRADDYASLARNTRWSLFGGDGFFINPAVDEGRMHSLLFTAEGGRVKGLQRLPRGLAFRLEAEVGDGLGGDFAFNRYLGDVRAYLPVSRFSSLSLRLRGGLASGDDDPLFPIQKGFTLGGAGTVRAYAHNRFYGTSMLLANAEYAVEGVELFDDFLADFQLFGLFDAGWVNGPLNDSFDFSDVIPAAGFGVGLDDRSLRLEIAWPLRDLGAGFSPTFWLRLNPTF